MTWLFLIYFLLRIHHHTPDILVPPPPVPLVLCHGPHGDYVAHGCDR